MWHVVTCVCRLKLTTQIPQQNTCAITFNKETTRSCHYAVFKNIMKNWKQGFRKAKNPTVCDEFPMSSKFNFSQ